MKRANAFIAVLLALLLCAQGAPAEAGCPGIETDIVNISKHGNLELSVTAGSMTAMGYAYGDMVTVTIDGRDWDMPVVGEFSDVDSGSMLCGFASGEGMEDSHVILAVNAGDMATALGIAAKIPLEEDPGYRWDYSVPTPVAVSIRLKEKGGYLDRALLGRLTRSNVRSDYPDLTDAQYANFRNIATTGMGAGALYRSSSPINPRLNRNREADEALNGAGIRTILNLADSGKAMRGYEDFAYTYYAQRDVIPLNLRVDFFAEDFKAGLAKGLEFLATHEGPYLIHCTEGKDRAGFVSALLECLMGASADEVVADYMVSFYNYYGVKPNSILYQIIAQSNIRKSLAEAFGVADIADADLRRGAEAYLASAGVPAEVVERVRERLGMSYAD